MSRVSDPQPGDALPCNLVGANKGDVWTGFEWVTPERYEQLRAGGMNLPPIQPVPGEVRTIELPPMVDHVEAVHIVHEQPVGVDAPGSREWMAEVCRAAALSLAAHGVHNDQLSKVADWITQQPAAINLNKITATFRCESNGIVGTTNAPVYDVRPQDDGYIEVVIDHWPQQPAADCTCPHQDAREPDHDVACPARLAQQPEDSDRPGSVVKPELVVANLLTFVIGEDVTRGGLLETPARVAKAWRHWCSGYRQNAADILKVFEDGAEGVSEMVVVRDIPIYSHCEHHLAPIFGTATIGYLPNGKIVGLSKLNRLADMFARRLQVQERMTNQIADALMEHLAPLGCGVVITARHMCMESRGVQQSSNTTTSALRGVFKDDATVRSEFLALAH